MSSPDTIVERNTTRMIDIDGGWKYGFPKPYPTEHVPDMNSWLIENGYPQFWIDYWTRRMGHVPCRVFHGEH